MNIQRKNSAHHFRMQSEHEQTLAILMLLFFQTKISKVHSELDDCDIFKLDER